MNKKVEKRNFEDKNTGNFDNTDNRSKCNFEDRNTGYFNFGFDNTGNRNRGIRNSGQYNIGNSNSMNFNKGDHNSGFSNIGDFNSGNMNVGCGNAGDWNLGNGNIGYFNTKNQHLMMFNIPTNWTDRDWFCSEARGILITMPKHIEWIDEENMTDEEKKKYPEYSETKGYLREKEKQELKNERQAGWEMLKDSDKQAIKSLPNFDSEIFEEITGIEIK